MKIALHGFLPRGAVVRNVALSFACLLSARLAGAPLSEDPPVGWWRDATFYEIFVRSFADASSGPLSGDGIGDLQGLIEHLDYLNDGNAASGKSLGVTAVWLMPVHPSPSYHGYDVSDYFGVNPQHGDPDLFRKFVREAHARGIRVIIDLVLNHASSEHPLFRAALAAPADSAARKLFRFAETPEQLTGPWGQRAWHRAGESFFYGVFSAGMPDWNLREPAVDEHHRRVADFWLRGIGVDGFRLDAVRYFVESGEQLQDTAETKAWLREFTSYCHRVKPSAFVVGECTGDTREIAANIRGGSLDSAFEFDLAFATLESLRLRAPGILALEQRRLEAGYGAESPWSTFLANHDQERTRSQLGGDFEKARFAAKLQFALPGVPFIYYGEEIGMIGTKPDPDLRTPMPWTSDAPNAGFAAANVKPWRALNADFGSVNVAAQIADPQSLLSLYRGLIRVNRDSPALRHGTPREISVSGRGVFGAFRETGREAVLVLINFGDTPARDASVTLARSAIRREWAVEEIFAGAKIAAPVIDDAGGFKSWAPFAELAPESVTVVRWRAKAIP